MFKEAFKTAVAVVFSQETAWKEIYIRKPDPYKEFLIPFWIILLLSSFLGGWLVSKEGSLAYGFQHLITHFFTLFVGFQVSSFFLNEYMKKMTDVEHGLKNARIFVAYSSSLVYIIDIIVSLVTDFFFLWLFALYTFYIVYIGAGLFLKVTPERNTNFTVIASLLILGIPLLLKFCLSLMVA